MMVSGLTPIFISTELNYDYEDVAPIDHVDTPPRQQEIVEHDIEQRKDATLLDHHSTTNSMSHLTPDDIKNLDEDINEWSPEQLEQLSHLQTAAIEAGPLITLNAAQLEALHVAYLNPIALSTVFTFTSHIGTLSDNFVNQITPEQAETILSNPKTKLSEYFTPDQIERLKTAARSTKLSIQDLTPEDIKNLDEDIINEWTPQQLSQLSDAQAAALTAIPLITLSARQLEALPVAALNPTDFSQIFIYSNNIGSLSDDFVNQITQRQAEAILSNPETKLTEYFTSNQIEHLKATAAKKSEETSLFHQPIRPIDALPETTHSALHDETQDINTNDFDKIEHSDAQPAPMPTNKPSWWRKLSPTLSAVVDGLVKQFSRKSSLSIASDAMRQRARGTYDPKNDQAVDNAFRELTTKQKDGIANDWLVETKGRYAAKNHALEQSITRISDLLSSLPEAVRERHVATLKAEINSNNRAMREEITAFTERMKRYLSPDEQLIPLESPSGMIRFECIDMSEIDPTKSIADQKQKLKNDGIINTYDANWWTGRQSSIHNQSLQDLYSNWISSEILQNYDPSQSIIPKIETSVLKLTKKPWADFDPSIQQAILDRINDYLKTQHKDSAPSTSDDSFEEIEAAMKQIAQLDQQEAQQNQTRPIDSYQQNQNEDNGDVDIQIKEKSILNTPAHLISTIDIAAISSLTPQEFNELSDDQIHALTRGQIRDLDATILAVVIPRLNADQMTYLKAEEVQTMSSVDFQSMIELASPQTLQQLDSIITPEQQKLVESMLDQHNQNLRQLINFADRTSYTAEKLSTTAAKDLQKEDVAASPSALLSPEEAIGINKKLFLNAYKNLQEGLKNTPELEAVVNRGHVYGDTVAKLLYDIILKTPTIINIPTESQVALAKRYITTNGI